MPATEILHSIRARTFREPAAGPKRHSKIHLGRGYHRNKHMHDRRTARLVAERSQECCSTGALCDDQKVSPGWVLWQYSNVHA